MKTHTMGAPAAAKVSVIFVVLVQLLESDAKDSQTWLFKILQKRRENGDVPPPIISTNKIELKSLNKCLTCPAPKDFKRKRLMRKIGHVNPKYLSISKPAVLRPKIKAFHLRMVRASERKLTKDFLKENALTWYSSHVTQKIEKILVHWLLRKSYCPLEHKWTDLGVHFWPRWIKIARCVGKPCSWPNGMSCSPSNRTLVSLLWWHCRPRTRRNSGKKSARLSKNKQRARSEKYACRWLKIKYPIINRCSCSCSNDT